MKVEIELNVICPECGCIMTRFAAGFVSCQTTHCGYYGRKFEKPTIAIHEIILEKWEKDEDINACL
jgi:hypothetical protein